MSRATRSGSKVVAARRYLRGKNTSIEEDGSRILKALQGLTEGDAVSEVIRLGIRRIIEDALEAEVADGIGRGYYERGVEGKSGYRSGYRRYRWILY